MIRSWRAAAPQLQLLSMIAIWGSSYAAVKTVLDRGVPPFDLLRARFWIAVACLLPPAVAVGRRALGTEALRGIATGVPLLIGYALQTFGIQQTTASMGGFLSGLITLFVAAGAVLVFGERLRAPTVFGLLLGAAGLALLCFGGDEHDGARKNTLAGIGLQIASSFSYAGHILLLSRLSRRGRELQYCWWQLLTVALGVTALAAATGTAAAPFRGADPTVWLCIAFLGVFALAIGISVQSTVQPRIPATQVAVLFATQPGFAALGGVVFLGDRMTTLEWSGGALIGIGVLVAELVRPRSSAGAAASLAHEHRDAARLRDGAQ